MTVHNLTSLASFRRALTIGSQWETRFVSKTHPALTIRREVTRSGTASARFKTLTEGLDHTSSSHYFGRSSQYDFNGDHVVARDMTGAPYATYRPLEAVQ